MAGEGNRDGGRERMSRKTAGGLGGLMAEPQLRLAEEIFDRKANTTPSHTRISAGAGSSRRYLRLSARRL